jgi:hypothetical protein
LHEIEDRELLPDQRQVGFVVSEECIPITRAQPEVEILAADLIRVDRLSATIHGDLDAWAQMPEGVFSPGKMNREIAADSTVFEKGDGTASVNGMRPNTAKIGERQTDQYNRSDERKTREPRAGPVGSGSTPIRLPT